MEPISGAGDFDFLHGRWHVQNQRLRERLKGSASWEVFDATLEVRPILGGLGNVDEYVTDHWGGRFVGMSLRLFDPARRLWTIYWVDNRCVVLQPPVVGGFSSGVGRFEGRDVHDGNPVEVSFVWSEIGPRSARWEQAFSPDGGRSWETNWVMRFSRPPDANHAGAAGGR